jgi:hypothetical protein
MIEKLASTTLARDGIAAIWQLHLAAAEAYRSGYPSAAASILEIAEAGARLSLKVRCEALTGVDFASSEMPMYRTIAVAISLMLLAAPASAATASGNSALALSALVSEHSRTVRSFDKYTLARLFAGHSNIFYSPGRTITVSADKIVCKTSDVDITVHSCDLSFGRRTITLDGRWAHELYATIFEVGVSPDGAAGTIFEALSQLTCTIDPNVVKQRAGGGADCNFTPGP